MARLPSYSTIGLLVASAGAASIAGRTWPLMVVGRSVCSLKRLTPPQWRRDPRTGGW